MLVVSWPRLYPCGICQMEYSEARLSLRGASCGAFGGSSEMFSDDMRSANLTMLQV
jgi:hypothetical protein